MALGHEVIGHGLAEVDVVFDERDVHGSDCRRLRLK